MLHRVDEAECGRGVARIETAGDDRARPAADSGENGDVLFSVGSLVGSRLSDYPRAALELPQQLACAGVDGLEPAIHRSVKHNIASGDESTTPDRQVFLYLPGGPTVDNIPGEELATVSAFLWRGIHLCGHADVRRSSGVIRFDVP